MYIFHNEMVKLKKSVDMDVKRNPISREHWAWIRLRLAEVGFPKWKPLAEKHQYTTSAFSITRCYAFPNIEKIIAETIGLAPQDVFPSRYMKDGKPIGRNYPRENRKTRKEIVP
jgi:lambda repressor-like predicted transcriptional regulator